MIDPNEFEDFICYLNDDDTKISGYVDILEITPSTVTFATKQGNVIVIPTARALKIKWRSYKEPEGEGR